MSRVIFVLHTVLGLRPFWLSIRSQRYGTAGWLAKPGDCAHRESARSSVQSQNALSRCFDKWHTHSRIIQEMLVSQKGGGLPARGRNRYCGLPMLHHRARSATWRFNQISNSIGSSIGAAHEYACYAEPCPDVRASYFPHDTATDTKNEGKVLGRCSVPLPWSLRLSPEEEIPNTHKGYPKNYCFCKNGHVRKKGIGDKYPEQQIHVHGRTVAGTALGDRQCRVLSVVAL